MKYRCLVCFISVVTTLVARADVTSDSLLRVYVDTAVCDSLRFDALENLLTAQPDSAWQWVAWMETLAHTSGDPLLRVKAGKQKANVLQLNGDPAQAAQVLQACVAVALNQPQPLPRMLARQYLGDLYQETGKLDEADQLYQLALQDARATGIPWHVAQVQLYRGELALSRGDYPLSLDLSFQAIQLLENNPSENPIRLSLLSSCNNNVAIVYAQMEDYPKARAYFEQSLIWAEKDGKKAAVAITIGNIAYLYYLEGAYDQSLEYGFRALEMEKRQGSLTASVLSNIGAAYEKKGDGVQALRYYEQSLAMFEAEGDASGVQRLLMSIGSHHQARNHLREAAAYSEKAYTLARELGYLENEKELAMRLYEIYDAQGQYQQALRMHVRYISLRDSINGDEAQQALIRYEFQEKALQDSIAFVQQQAASDLATEHQKTQRNASLAALLLVAILAGILYYNGRRRRQTNILLTAQKAEIQAKSNQNELLLKEIHHRVKNNLQTISSLLYLQSAHIKDPEVREAVAAGQHRVESMALIHQKLYQRDTLAAIEMKDYLSNLVTSLIQTFDADPERIRFHLDMPELELDVDTAVPLGLIVNELITNSLKYAFPDGRQGVITVSLRKTDTGLELFVGDDGVGAANTLTGTAFGSQLVRLLTAQLGGKLETGTEGGYWTRVRMG
ncbi:MAG: histidine kinase dimerization/phosphoacceptor domain -containing protein [Bacteroidia bacterium]|nr:histidine kinase dimerization/phosphoacceptor domain -containing protein [Bacteroidia bacterium]